MQNTQGLTSKICKVQKRIFTLILILTSLTLRSQDPDKTIRLIFDEALSDNTAYSNLEYLSKKAAGRINGSPAAARAVEFTRQALVEAGADSVWLQKVPVPSWERGTEKCTVSSKLTGKKVLPISALGLSVGTSDNGIISEIIEVHDFEELKVLGRSRIEGKIVFFNRPVDNRLINSFSGYGGAVNQRTQGASEASKLGAIAVIVRSATQALDDYPHTGGSRSFKQFAQI